MSFPTLEKFTSDITEIYIEGNIAEQYGRLKTYIEEYGLKDEKGNRLTYKYVLDKFREHHKWWNHTYGRDGDLKYVKAKDIEKRKNLYDFLGEGLYKNEFSLSKNNLDRNTYLFGDFSLEYLVKLKDQFVNQFK